MIVLAMLCLPTTACVGSACSGSTAGTKPSVRQEPAAAGDELTALRQKAAAGDAYAQNQLGLVYLTGSYITKDLADFHVTKDEAHAVQWFRKAAEQGFPEAQNQLGVMYLHGRGVPKDDMQALEWIVKAAEQGLPEAHVQLAWFSLGGHGGAAKDNVEALKQLTIASTLEKGAFHSVYVEQSERIARNMTPTQIAEAERRSSEWVAAFEKRKK